MNKLEKGLVNKAEKFESKHKIISLLIIMLLTILITRLIVHFSDPNLFLGKFELHHFYYGLVLLVVVSLLMLFQRGHFKLHLTLIGISLGLIIDELVFVGTKVRSSVAYSSTFSSTIIIAIVIILIAELIVYISKRK